MMKTKNKWLLLLPLAALVLGLVAACGKAAPITSTAPAGNEGYANPELLASTEWLSQHLNDANLVVVDVRKAADYQSGHIKGAVNIEASNFKSALYDQGDPVKWRVLTEDQAEKLFGSLGIDNDTTVVAVDGDNPLWASRLFWTLEYYGHGDGKARVLDGGMKKWKAENRELTDAETKITAAKFDARPQPAKLATKQQVLDAIGKAKSIILATIPEAEFKGGNKNSLERAGHVPGAAQLDWTQNLTGDPLVFKPAAELKGQYEALGFTKDKDGIVY